MYIKDNETGQVRKYGTNHHDSLMISDDGRYLSYCNLQCGEGSLYGGYSFVTDENGILPKDDEVLVRHGAEAYFNIGGWDDADRVLDKIERDIKDLQHQRIFESVSNYSLLDTVIEIIDKYRGEA